MVSADGAETMKGAEMVVRGLLRAGARSAFGHPGGAVLPVYDALHGSDIVHYLMRHEQGAAHAAEGFARASGRAGVCIATSGPGACNLVTGLADANMDSIPVVAVTGQVALTALGSDAFQEADTIGITMPIVKHSYLVREPEDIPRVLHEAFHIAGTGRPGPVLVDLPKDVASRSARAVWPTGVPRVRGYRPLPPPVPVHALERACELVERSERPLLMIGGGCVKAQAQAEVVELTDLLGCPAIATLMGLGVLPASHPAHLGMMGMHGTPIANIATTQCDLLIGVGVRFDDRVTGALHRFAPQAKVIHLDIDPAEIGKNVPVNVALVGDCRQTLRRWIAALRERDVRRPWLPEIGSAHRPEDGRPFGYPEEAVGEAAISGPATVRALAEATRGQAIVVTDVGQHQMWAAQHYPFERPGQFITSGGLGTMGFGLPAAIGAQVARPQDTVVLLTGDGSFQMTLQELAVVRAYNLPLKIVIFNNGYLGMVRQWQELFFQERYSYSELWNPDFCALAAAYSIPAVRVEHTADLERTLQEAVRQPGPVLVDVHQVRNENTWPIVPSGQALEDMIVRPGATRPAPRK